jgi:hypothetical protein
MTGHRLEVADVFRAHQEQFLQRWGYALSDPQRRVLRDIGLCRTAALGTHLERCDRCNYETVAYDSCRNRHCPKCQSSARDRWLLKQAASLLPVPYVHAVFTVPEQLAPLGLRNRKLFYSMLFRAASETLSEIAADPRHAPHRLSAKSIQSPYIHRVSGLAQIAVSTLLRLYVQAKGNLFTRSTLDTALEIEHQVKHSNECVIPAYGLVAHKSQRHLSIPFELGFGCSIRSLNAQAGHQH